MSRGSSQPQISSAECSTSGRRSGSGSKRQSEMPSALRATCSMEIPRRSSTRVEEDGLVPDPGSARVEDGVGGDMARRPAVMIGFDAGPLEELGRSGPWRQRDRPPLGAGVRDPVCGSHRSDPLKGDQPHQRRLGSLVRVDTLRREAIEARAALWDGDRHVADRCRRGTTHTPAPSRHDTGRAPVASMGGFRRQQQRRRLDRLLVESRLRAPAWPPPVADRVRDGRPGRVCESMSQSRTSRPAWSIWLESTNRPATISAWAGRAFS